MGDVASYSVFSVVLSAFLWAGMQLCLLGVEEFRMRSFCPPLPVEGDGERVQWHRLATLAVFVVEDVPQVRKSVFLPHLCVVWRISCERR